MADNLLAVRNLSVITAVHQTPLVEGVSFEIERGEFLGVVGESGSGKTMVARSILRLLPPGIRQSGGDILFLGENIGSLSPSDLRKLRGAKIGMVFQEPMTSLNPAHTVGAQMAEGLRLHTRLSSAEIRSRSLEMLERVQISNPGRCLTAYPHEFSGGMRQRIILAAVMMLRPQLIIADEPTTALDNLTQREVLDLMTSLARDCETAVMLITHNLGLVSNYADRAIVLEGGRLVETGTASDILTSPREAYTRKLVSSIPGRSHATSKTVSGEPVISVRQVSVDYGARSVFRRGRGMIRVLHDVDLDIRPAETVAVVGGSGSGKTTLGRAILNLVPTASGSIVFKGRDMGSFDRQEFRAFRLACQFVFQDPYSSLNPRMRVRDIVGEPLRHLPELTVEERARRIDEILAEVNLDALGHRWPHELSGGQRQRVAIARALIRRPQFIVADEPVSALDMTVQAQVLKLLKDLQARHHFACLFISHDLAAVEQVADRIVVMQNGKIVETGSRDRIFDNPQHPYTVALLDAAPSIRAQPHAKLH